MGKARWMRWAGLPVLALALALAACNSSSSSSSETTPPATPTPTTTGDTYRVVFDGGAATDYAEAVADNAYGYEPYIVAWKDTVNNQMHVIVVSGVQTTGASLVVAIAYEPPDAVGVPNLYQEARYEADWAGTADPLYLDEFNGTITITATAAAVGDVVEGSFDGFTGFLPAGGPHTTLSGSFKATRAADDLF